MTEGQRFARLASLVALFGSPAVALWLIHNGHSATWAVVIALGTAVLLRGLAEVIRSKFIDEPELFTQDDDERSEDALRRRRSNFWLKKFRLLGWYLGIVTALWLLKGGSWEHHFLMIKALSHVANKRAIVQLIVVPFLFLANFAIFFGPLMLMGASQINGFEPGDADWGVKLDHVRGQKEAKDEVNKVITLWQSGREFEKAGGKRERGILFLGAPGTGKTMLAKAIATGFNCPIVTIPGSGFAQTFIGIDAVIVRFLARKARKLAAKWGGTCIIFIDEIDAVGMRRNSLGTSSKEGRNQLPGGMFGGMGSLALNQLLVVMDGIDNPPFFKRFVTSKTNLLLDAVYVPPKIGKVPLRLPKAKPTGNQIYFVGATNVPIEQLDPALVRPGRLGRHITFRQPTKKDRLDIFDLYLGKVAHDPELDTPKAREELARLTGYYSPAEIEQVCSLALTYAHNEGRMAFERKDILEAMVTVESGTALGWGYESKEEERSTAIHEAGHAVCAHLYVPNRESTRLSIKRRGRTGGHHQTAAIEERTFYHRDELFYDLVWGLGAHAAESTFYDENNSNGVYGDLQSVSYTAGNMVGLLGMAPMPFTSKDPEKTRKRLQTVGRRILAVARSGDTTISGGKYDDECELVGLAYIVAFNTVRTNKSGIEHIVDQLLVEKEIYGNDLMKLLDEAVLTKPDLNLDKEETWPTWAPAPKDEDKKKK